MPQSDMATSASLTFPAESQMIFRPALNAEITCYWCRKIVQACDGQRTLAQVGELLHLPLAICLKLIERAQRKGWVEISSAPAAAPASLWERLLTELGEGSGALLAQAARMSRCEPAQIPAHEVSNFLIAVELLLPEAQRLLLLPTLDRLNRQYGLAEHGV